MLLMRRPTCTNKVTEGGVLYAASCMLLDLPLLYKSYYVYMTSQTMLHPLLYRLAAPASFVCSLLGYALLCFT